MPTRAELWPVLGPLLDIGPRVFVVMAAGILAVAAAMLCGRALRDRRPVLFLAMWLGGVASVGSLALGLASLAAFGRPSLLGSPEGGEPLSMAGASAFAVSHLAVGAIAAGGGVLVAVALAWRRSAADVSAEAVLLASVPDRARAVGDAGESLVGCELFCLGLPQLRGVILREGRRTVELDHLVRVADGIVVLETKAWSGFVSGTFAASDWVRHGKGGQRDALLNPALQNAAHVGAVERFLADPAVAVRGLVVGAGSARFAPDIAPVVVPLGRLGAALEALAWPGAGDQAAIEAAWRRLGREAERSAGRRAAHADFARRSKRAAQERVVRRRAF